MKRSYFLGLCMTGALLFFGAPAHAQTVSQTKMVDWTLNDWGPTSLVFDKFDTSLGTLTSVTVEMTGHIRGSGTLTNGTATPRSYTTFGVQGSLALFDSGNVNQLGVVTPFSGSGPGTVPAMQSQNFNFLDQSQSTGLINLTPTSAYLGPGTVTFNAASEGFTTFTGSTSISTSTSSEGKASVTLIYNYTSAPVVPEPGALALALPGLAPLGLVLRRRMAKK